jgi:competence protein ComEC
VGLLTEFLGPLSYGVASFLNSLNAHLIALLQTTVTHFPASRATSFNIAPPSVAFCITFYLLLFSIGFGRSFRSFRKLLVPKIALAIATVALFVGGELARRHPDSLEITFLDVGQGDCALVEFPDGRTMLVDGGSINKRDVGRYVIVPFLRWSGVNKLDAIILTHYDADHINGLRSVIREIGARTVLRRASPPALDTPVAQTLTRAVLEDKRITTQPIQAGDQISLSPQIQATVLHPQRGVRMSHLSENDLSVVLKLGFQGSLALMTGDIEQRAEQTLIRRSAPLRSHLLKVPHHGSNSSSNEDFIRHVSPSVAVISCGRRNIYGHPSSKVLDRYDQFGVRVFRTDLDGGIIVRLFNDKLTVTTTL